MRLNHDLLPMVDYHKAKALMWDPRHIDCAQDLAPLLVAVRRAGGHIEDEFFLTAQIFEEAKHMEFFDRWFDEVVGGEIDLTPYLGESYGAIFYQALPEALNRLLDDYAAMAQVEASVVYHMIIEGVLAETGYHGFYQALRGRGLLPGLVQGIEYVQRDEARHIAFGVYFLQRHVQANPALWPVVAERMNDLLPAALNIVGDVFIPYGDHIPFDLDVAALVQYAAEQFARRIGAVERASGDQGHMA